jgi:hypothetical protein
MLHPLKKLFWWHFFCSILAICLTYPTNAEENHVFLHDEAVFDVEKSEFHEDFVLDALSLENSILNKDASPPFHAAMRKLLAGECLNFVVIGGSVSCGHILHWEHATRLNWPTLFGDLFNRNFPCKGGHNESSHAHQVYNRCTSGHGR